MNIGNPSPQEIFDSYSQIPNTPQGKQMLTNLVQAFKNSGDMRGSIATSILNSYNSQQPPAPPPPQGQVADHVVAQAQPHPDFKGIGAPGLDLTAPPGMATGGLVAFAQGGPVRGFWGGGDTDLSGEYNPFMEGMPDVPDAPDISGAVNDYYSAPPAPPPATSNPGDVGNDLVSRISRMQELYGTPPDIAAELISKHEHDQAKREKFNAFENIAAALGGYLSAYGPGQHRAGAGIAAMLGQMGQHDREAQNEASTMDALRVRAAMQPYETHKGMVDQVLAAEAANRKAQEEAAMKMWEARYGRETKLMEGKQGGEYGLRREGMQGQTSRDVAGINKEAKIEAANKGSGWDRSKFTGASKGSILSSIINQGNASPEEIIAAYRKIMSEVDPEFTGATGGQTPGLGAPMTGKDPKGNPFNFWLR